MEVGGRLDDVRVVHDDRADREQQRSPQVVPQLEKAIKFGPEYVSAFSSLFLTVLRLLFMIFSLLRLSFSLTKSCFMGHVNEVKRCSASTRTTLPRIVPVIHV